MKKPPPLQTPGDVQIKLKHLRNRRAALDELILCMERYTLYQMPAMLKKPVKIEGVVLDPELAGAA
jgi:hypothetical protein